MFLSRKPILHMVSQPENRLDFGQMMDTGKIFLAKLPEGLLGKENSYLLGTLLISKFHQLAMSRQAQQISARRDWWIYADEFHNFITPSLAEVLAGARKYRIITALQTKCRLHDNSCNHSISKTYCSFSHFVLFTLLDYTGHTHSIGNRIREFRCSRRHSVSKSGGTAWSYTGSKQMLPQRSEFLPHRSAIGSAASLLHRAE